MKSIFSLLLLLLISTNLLAVEVGQNKFLLRKKTQIKKLEEPTKSFTINNGRWFLSGSVELKDSANRLLKALQEIKFYLKKEYHFEDTEHQIHIKLLTEDNVLKQNTILHWDTSSESTILPFVLNTASEQKLDFSQFSFFQLLKAIIEIDLIHGSKNRYPISFQAKPLVEGLASYLSIHAIESKYLLNREEMIQNMEIMEQYSLIEDQYPKNDNFDNFNNSLIGFTKFLDGVEISKQYPTNSVFNSDLARLFYFFEEKKKGSIKEIIKLLSKENTNWTLIKDTEDCEKLCSPVVIDYSRASIIIEKVTGESLAQRIQGMQILKKENKLVKHEEKQLDTIPTSVLYQLKYPYINGDNQSFSEFSFTFQNENINSRQVLDNESLATQKSVLKFGVLDEAFKSQVVLEYNTGEKTNSVRQTVLGKSYSIDQKIRKDEFRGGTATVERGMHSGIESEYGFYYHWSRLQVRWDLSRIANLGIKNNFIHRSYHLLEAQGIFSKKLTRELDIGLETSTYLGFVNHSASTGVVANKKLNEDTSSFIAGVKLQPKIKFSIPEHHFGAFFHVGYEYLWQPIDNDAANNDTSESINSTQVVSSIGLGLELLF